jgi:hypothetical protein
VFSVRSLLLLLEDIASSINLTTFDATAIEPIVQPCYFATQNTTMHHAQHSWHSQPGAGPPYMILPNPTFHLSSDTSLEGR